MRKRAFVIAVVGMLLLGGCIKTPSYDNSGPAERAPLSMAVLIEGSVYDQGWDSEAYAALAALDRTYGADVTYVEFHNRATPVRVREAVERLIAEGRTLIVGHGAVFAPVLEALGRRYPQTMFVSINGEADGENVVPLFYSGYSTGFLAGAMAALMSRHGIVGIVSAYPEQAENDGFRDGAHYVNPDTRVLTAAVGSWGDRAGGRAAAKRLVDQGAEVLFPAGDAFAIEVIDVARLSGRYAVGFIIDQSFIARNTVVTSVMQNVRELYDDIYRRACDGTLGELRGKVLDVQSGGERLSPFGPMVPKDVEQKMRALYEALQSGRITEAELVSGSRKSS